MSIRTRIALHKLASNAGLRKEADWLDSAANFVKNAPQKALDWAGRQLADSDAAEYRKKNNDLQQARNRQLRDAGKAPESWDATNARNARYTYRSPLGRAVMRGMDSLRGRTQEAADTGTAAIAGTAKREGALNQQIREQQAELERLRAGQARQPTQQTGGLKRAIQTAQGAKALYNKFAPHVESALKVMPPPTQTYTTPAPVTTPAAPQPSAQTPAPANASPVTNAATGAVNAAAQGVGQTYDRAVGAVTDAAKGVGDTVQTAASIPGNVAGSTLNALGLQRTGQVAQKALNLPGEVAGNAIRGVSDFAGNIARGDFKKGFVNAGQQIGRDVSNLFTGWWK